MPTDVRVCPLCDQPDDGPVSYRVELWTYRRRGWRGACWSSRTAICATCWGTDDGNYRRRESADGKRSAHDRSIPSGREIVTCEVCTRSVSVPIDKRRKVDVCSDACRSRLYAARSVTEAVTHPCEGCGTAITGRVDRRYCSSACRQRAYRQREVSSKP